MADIIITMILAPIPTPILPTAAVTPIIEIIVRIIIITTEINWIRPNHMNYIKFKKRLNKREK